MSQTLSHRRLEQLYEISKLLTQFGTAEATFDSVLTVVARTLPLRSAILIEEATSGFRMTIWPTDAEGTDSMRAAVRHLESSFAYLVGAASPDSLGVKEELGRTALPATPGATRRPGRAEPFILIPLVIRRGEIFGAIQVEAASAFNEADLIFINSIGNQLAVAVDRDRARRQDIVRRQRAEVGEAVADGKRVAAEMLTDRFESLVDNLDHAFVWEADGQTFQLSFVSARAETLLGHPRGQWLAASGGWLSFVHAEDRQAVAATLRRALAMREDQRCEHRCLALDGRVMWFHTGVHPIDVEGGPPRLQGVSLDISTEKEAEEVQAFLLEATRILGASLEDAGTLRRVARLALPRLGDFCFFDVVAADGTLRRQAAAHVDPREQERYDQAWYPAPPLPGDHPARAIVRTGKSELAREQDEGLPPAGWASSLLRVPVRLGNRVLAALTFGITERGRHGASQLVLAEELAMRAAFALENGRLYEQARSAVKLREQVLAVVSHDLRNPLGTILMAVESLAARFQEGVDERGLATLGRIERAARNMLRFVTDLLDFASIEAGKLSVRLQVNDTAAIFPEVVASFAAAAKAQGVTITHEPEEPLPPVLCDRDRVLQVLSNLIGNALKVQPRGGAIWLRARADDREVTLSVSDGGPGLDAAELARIFERYGRGRAAGYAGTGLGLAIASGIVEQHGGRIWAESSPGEGATFFFTLPRAR